MISKIKIGIILIFAILFLFYPAMSIGVTEKKDQAVESGPTEAAFVDNSHLFLQTFKPSLNFLTKITVLVGSMGARTLHYVIYTNGHSLVWGDVTVNGEMWATLTVNKDVMPETSHSIILSTPNPNILWAGTTDRYSRGYAIVSGTVRNDVDMYFRSYGYNKEEERTPPPSGDDGDSTIKVGSEPSTEIDTSIGTPINLKAENISDQEFGKVKLTWEASETPDIDGYRVFTKVSGGDYALIAENEKDNLEYTNAPLQFGIEYAYMVRTVRDEKESDNSNEVLITPQKPTSASPETDWFSNIYLWLIIPGVAIIALVVWYLVQRNKRKKFGKITQ